MNLSDPFLRQNLFLHQNKKHRKKELNIKCGGTSANPLLPVNDKRMKDMTTEDQDASTLRLSI